MYKAILISVLCLLTQACSVALKINDYKFEDAQISQFDVKGALTITSSPVSAAEFNVYSASGVSVTTDLKTLTDLMVRQTIAQAHGREHAQHGTQSVQQQIAQGGKTGLGKKLHEFHGQAQGETESHQGEGLPPRALVGHRNIAEKSEGNEQQQVLQPIRGGEIRTQWRKRKPAYARRPFPQAFPVEVKTEGQGRSVYDEHSGENPQQFGQAFPSGRLSPIIHAR